MASNQLETRELTITECVPTDLSFVAEYQKHAYGQIVWDDVAHTIQGIPPRSYMLNGIKEELEETTGEDRREPNYNRLQAILLTKGAPFDPGHQTPTAIERHTKEFGDVSWYLANYLSLYGIDITQTVRAGVIACELNRASAPRAPLEFVLDTERKFPWGYYLHTSKKLIDAVDSIASIRRRDERSEAEKQLIISSGQFITSMMHISAARFGLTYEEVLDQNKKKLAKRIADDTIFDKDGGDDR